MRRLSDVYRRLTVLAALAAEEKITQRALAAQLSISLGLTNGLLRQMAAEGLISVTEVGGSRLLRYAITAAGRRALKGLAGALASDAGVMLEGPRSTLAEQARRMKGEGVRKVLLCGTGPLADVAASALQNGGLKPAGVVSRDQSSDKVAGMRVRPIADTRKIKFDAVVAVSPRDAALLRRHVGKGVPVIAFLSRSTLLEKRRG